MTEPEEQPSLLEQWDAAVASVREHFLRMRMLGDMSSGTSLPDEIVAQVYAITDAVGQAIESGEITSKEALSKELAEKFSEKTLALAAEVDWREPEIPANADAGTRLAIQGKHLAPIHATHRQIDFCESFSGSLASMLGISEATDSAYKEKTKDSAIARIGDNATKYARFFAQDLTLAANGHIYITGTDIPLSALKDDIVKMVSYEEILEKHPGLTQAQLKVADVFIFKDFPNELGKDDPWELYRAVGEATSHNPDLMLHIAIERQGPVAALIDKLQPEEVQRQLFYALGSTNYLDLYHLEKLRKAVAYDAASDCKFDFTDNFSIPRRENTPYGVVTHAALSAGQAQCDTLAYLKFFLEELPDLGYPKPKMNLLSTFGTELHIVAKSDPYGVMFTKKMLGLPLEEKKAEMQRLLQHIPDTIQFLLAHGSDPRIRNSKDETPRALIEERKSSSKAFIKDMMGEEAAAPLLPILDEALDAAAQMLKEREEKLDMARLPLGCTLPGETGCATQR